ncbi:ferredoxin [Arthrobacter sp. 18067]|uniref:ferredoxin n=1 Tax=Arthrobacter sp. 18067 TaxID=2681413 RepID=UPI00135CC62E|nr:ferredoxin [Arthrobacter sp. 18067]
MTLMIDYDRCQGHGRCSLISPQLFDLTPDDGLGVVLIPEPGSQFAQIVAQAVGNCPEQAISYVERSSS